MRCYPARTKNDLEFVSGLYRKNNTRFLNTKKLSVKDLLKLKTFKNRADYILEEDYKKIGWFSLVNKINGRETTFSIIIDKKFQGLGYGKKAMALIEQEAKKMKIKMITALVDAQNIPARKLYKGVGFQENKTFLQVEKKIAKN